MERLDPLAVHNLGALVEDELHTCDDCMIRAADPVKHRRQLILSRVVRGVVGGDPDLLLERPIHGAAFPGKRNAALLKLVIENGFGRMHKTSGN